MRQISVVKRLVLTNTGGVLGDDAVVGGGKVVVGNTVTVVGGNVLL